MADRLLETDRILAENVVFTMGDPGIGNTKKVKILFQFPPKVLTDSRTGSWFETELPGNQPIAIWKTSGARKWTLEWTYVIGASGWNTQKVRDQITNLRSYWSGRENLASNFIVDFWIWKLGGKSHMTCRLTNIDITHGKALYVEGNDYTMAHPVVTNVKVAMQLWTLGGKDAAGAQADLDKKRADETAKLAKPVLGPDGKPVPGVKMAVSAIATGVLPGWQ